ncbi:hypothetical protein ACFO3O_03465 [Dokdonia ponticola]|uniref:Uncharacterized protein n=1 Tax=Dokdonia ponticola TaxID=2041041 RepID=A0ABV9HSM7_9FLAO
MAQDLLVDLAKEMCLCFESKKLKNAAETRPCYDELFQNNYSKIEDYYNTENLSEDQLMEFETKIAATTLNNCQYIYDHFPSGIVGEEKIVNKQENVVCDNLKNAKFYYLIQRPNSPIRDTTFVTISGDSFLEQMTYQDTYSLSKIVWKDHCKYELTFQETNDPFRKEILEHGQVFEYEVISNTEESFFAKTVWKGRPYRYELIKLK